MMSISILNNKTISRMFAFIMALILTAVFAVCAATPDAAAQNGGSVFYAEATMTENEISVIFGEKPIGVNFESTIILNTENEKRLKINGLHFSDTRLKISISGTESAYQYLIILPENIKSDKGNVLFDRYIYAVSPALGTNTQQIKAVNDTFDDYYDTGSNINVPNGWMNRNRSSLNHVKFYSDSEHDKAVEIQRPNSGWTETCFTRNFGKNLNGKFSIEFDFNPLYFNKYIDGEEDPELLKAVVDSVNKARGWTAQNGFTYKYLNANMSFALAPVAENGEKRYNSSGTELKPADNFWPDADMTYVSSDKLITAPTFFQLYGNRLGFAELGEQPTDGKFIRVETEKWYHVKLDFNMETLEVSGMIDGESIGTVSLPSEYADKQYGNTAARAMFFMRGNNNLPLENNKAVYIDSQTGEEITYTHINASHFAIDNFDVIYTAPEFKICGTEFIGADRSFGPQNKINALISRAKIMFTLDADIDTLNSDNFVMLSDDGEKYDFNVLSYDDENYVADIEIDGILKNGSYTISANNIQSTNGSVIPEYVTKFEVEMPNELIISDTKAVDKNGAEINSAKSGDEVYAVSSVANGSAAEHNISAFSAIYKNTEYGLKMTGFCQKRVNIESGKSIVFSSDKNSVCAIASGDGDIVNAHTDNSLDFSKTDKRLKISAIDNTVKISGVAEPNDIIKVEIPDSGSDYEEDKNSELLFCGITAADSGGNYEIKIDFEGINIGNYNAYLYFEKAKEYIKNGFSYTKSETVNNAAKTLDNADGETEIKNLFTADFAAESGVGTDIYNKADLDGFAKLAKSYMTVKNFSDNTADENIRLLNEFCIISAVYGGTIENLFGFDDVLKLGESEIKDWYKKDFVSAEMQKLITRNSKGKNYSKADDFYDELTDEFILSAVADNDGSVSELIIPAFAKRIGLSKTPTANICIKVSGTRYNSLSELKNEIEKESINNASAGGSTGGGSGGGGAIAKTSDVTLPSTTDNDSDTSKEPMIYDVFDDIDDVEWAKAAIVYLAEKGIINGVDKNKFAPNDFIKREELVKILAGAFIKNDYDTSVPFEDTAADEWYYPFIARAYNSGIVSGYDEKTFGVGDVVTREDMAVMLYNASVASGKAYDKENYTEFDDDELISDYAKEAVYALKNAKIINGTDLRHFSPKESATRAEAAKIIFGLLNF